MQQSISDQDLLRRSFFSSNPLEEPNLIHVVPRGIELVGILSAYEHRAFRLPCAECGAARHYKGFVVELANGKRALLGNHCGRRLFRDGWDAAGRIFHELVDRQALLRRREWFLPKLSVLIALAQNWSRRLAQPSALIQEARIRFPLLMDRLRERVERSDGILMTERYVAGPNGKRIETVTLKGRGRWDGPGVPIPLDTPGTTCKAARQRSKFTRRARHRGRAGPPWRPRHPGRLCPNRRRWRRRSRRR